ncbi:MAG: chaperone NapD [Gammaproteobacteria bacterium]
MPGATVPASDPVGKLVVVLETETESDILSMTTQITAMKGVLTALIWCITRLKMRPLWRRNCNYAL